MNLRSGPALVIFSALLAVARPLCAQTPPFTAPAGLALHVVFNTTVGTAISHSNDEVQVRLVEPALIAGRQVLPQGTLFLGRVLAVHSGDWSGDILPALRLSFTKVALPDGSTVPVRASLAYLEHQRTLKVDGQGAVVPAEPERLAPKAYTTPAYNSSASFAENLAARAIMGLVRAGVRRRQYHDFKLNEGRKARLILDSDLVIPAQRQTGTAKTPVAPGAGTISGNAYRNEFFGLSYSYPQGWHIESEEAQKEVALRGHETVFRENPNQEPGERSAEHQAAMQRTLFLFRATENAGSEMRPSSVQIVAFDLSGAPSLPEPTTMLAEVAQAITSKGGEVLEQATETAIAGRRFAVARYKLTVEGPDKKTTTGFQASALTYDRGYALIWFFVANDQDGAAELVKTLNSLSFAGNAEAALSETLGPRETDKTLRGGLAGGFQEEGTFLVYKKEGSELSENWATLKSLGKRPSYETNYSRLAATINFEWRPDGSYVNRCSSEKEGPIDTTVLPDKTGEWASITVTGIRGVRTLKNLFPGQERLEFVRKGNEVSRTSIQSGKSVETDAFTIPFVGAFLFHPYWRNEYDPALLTPLLRRYDKSKGGEQTFPVFNFLKNRETLALPADVVLEMRGVTERHLGEQDLHLTSFYYRYEAKEDPEHATWFVTHLSLLADDEGRIFLGGLPNFTSQDTAKEIFVRKGYEALRDDPSLISIVARTSSSIHYGHH